MEAAPQNGPSQLSDSWALASLGKPFQFTLWEAQDS